MSDYNISLLDWQDGKGPQYKASGQNVMRPHEGDVAPYQQIVDINGVPFSSSNRLPIDATNQTLSTQITGSNVALSTFDSNGSITKETIVSAQSVAAAGEIEFSFTTTDEKEIWFSIAIDQQPWSLQTSQIAYNGHDGTRLAVFPVRDQEANTYISAVPALSYFNGNGLSGEPTTIEEAKALRLPYTSTVNAQIVNDSANLATATIEIIRVWGD